ncbi:LysR family transcriptional regulator [Pseudomonas sp. NPDC089408]|uniref:LysR family transcriptional regulator n=1 Tax=unclassified Pseudomonas TaxID=196821 RepID=UPI003816438B
MAADIRKLDLNLLRALDALLDERSVTRAAERLSLTQPAVTGMLNRLRESFDDPLFVRAQRGIVPTIRAEALARPVKQLLADVEGMLQPDSFDPQTAEMIIKVASTDYALRAIVVPFLSALRQQAPNIKISVLPIDDQLLHVQMDRGDVDIALVDTDAAVPGLHTEFLFNERYVCVMRADHPDAKSSTLSLDRFCALDHVLVSPSGGGFCGVTDEALRRIGRARRVTVSVTSFLVLPEILSVSDLIAVVPHRLAIRQTGLAIVDPPVDIPGFSKLLAWHERTARDAGHRWLRALMAQTATTL